MDGMTVRRRRGQIQRKAFSFLQSRTVHNFLQSEWSLVRGVLEYSDFEDGAYFRFKNTATISEALSDSTSSWIALGIHALTRSF